MGEAVTFGAFRAWPDDFTGQEWRAHLETEGVGAVAAGLRIAEQRGLITASHTECRDKTCAVLDLIDAHGDIVGDRCIPRPEAFAELATLLELRCTSWDALPDGGVDRPDLLAAVRPHHTSARGHPCVTADSGAS